MKKLTKQLKALACASRRATLRWDEMYEVEEAFDKANAILMKEKEAEEGEQGALWRRLPRPRRPSRQRMPSLLKSASRCLCGGRRARTRSSRRLFLLVPPAIPVCKPEPVRLTRY